MATTQECACTHQIGEMAGTVWRLLESSGPISMTKLIKEADGPRDLVMQAVGWLAREDKLQIDETSRGKMVSLK